ncbi:MAG TPA: amidohydrolase family protein [Chloroflexota bacterium]|jgi:4-oxalmesaconate hydratase|nr:amidohydrolase family protein [Chloroflexota bacterium]
MIIDVHGHYTTAPAALRAYRANQIINMARPTKGSLNISDEQIRASLENSQLKLQRERGTDLTLFSPQASAMGHHFGNELISRYWTEVNNELIHRVCQLYPDEFVGVCQLPQSPGVSPKNCVEELRRCVLEFGFVGCNLNPDPSGGVGPTPSLGDEWWYPLYEALVELDVPAMIHVSASINPAWHTTATYYINSDTAAVIQLLESRVFEDFPTLKIVIPHGGGAVPYQLGRYRGIFTVAGREPFEEAIKKLYFDTAIYSPEAMETLIKAVGVDNVLFASEMVGAVNAIDPKTGRWFDDTKPYIESLAWLSPEDRKKIFEDNAKRVYPRLQQHLERRQKR